MAATTVSRTITNQIRSRILLSGPIPVADYMRLALTQNSSNATISGSSESSPDGSKRSRELGYYMKKDVFGEKGDFITSPEITQMFGELMGVWGIQCWKQLWGPSKFNVVELGPGRGTLSRDMLGVFRQFESISGKDVSLNLVEVSPYLSKLQHETLCKSKMVEMDNASSSESPNAYLGGNATDSNYPVTWYKDLRDTPKEFSFYIAHEFFDALPIHKLQKVNNEWRELLIDVKPDTEDGFRFVLSRHETPVVKVLKSHYPTLLESSRQHMEVSLDALVILEELISRLDAYGGMAIIVDYGHDGTKEDTFRAFYKHHLHDPLVAPGTADLTADVDFSVLRQVIAEKALICGPTQQQQFLRRIGIDVRLEILLKKAKSESEKAQLKSGYEMIMNDMGSRFQMFGLFPKVLEPFLPKLKIAGFHE